MHPIAFHLGQFPVRFSGVTYVLAIAVAWWYAHRLARSEQWDTDKVLPGLALVVLAAYLGARLHGSMLDWEMFRIDPIGTLLRPAGLSFSGGLVTGGIVLITYLHLAGVPVGRGADALAWLAPGLYALFRVGCFLNGDDYGRLSTVPWAISFPEGSPPVFERVHPAQLYEIALMIPVYLGARVLSQRPAPPGALALGVVALMGAGRFLVEFVRSGLPGVPVFFDAQWLAAGQVILGLAGWLWLTARSRVDVG